MVEEPKKSSGIEFSETFWMICHIASFVPLGIGLLFLGAQSFDWLKTGVWKSLSTLRMIQGFNHSAFENWLGVQKILAHIPFWLACCVIGTLILLAKYPDD